MRSRRQTLRHLALALGLLHLALPGSPCAAQGPEPHRAHAHSMRLGTVRFPSSAAAAARPAFVRGVTLLHSFEYWDAADAFRTAERADPGFAPAYWMEALTYSHPLWGEEDLDSARAALARLGPDAAARLAKARTPRERSYGAAIEAYFRDAPDSLRRTAFADSMRALVRAYPTDLEAKAFAALAVMTTADFGPREAQDRAVAEAIGLARAVFRASPQHPGAAHYLIHLYDDPRRAPGGLDAARKYARIAPDAEHALHMPSHIFLQLGLWDDVAASNERAWAASRADVARHHLTGTDLSFHALYWLQYAYLEQGRFRAAHALVDTARAVLGAVPDSALGEDDARYAVQDLAFAYAMATGRWDDRAVREGVSVPGAERRPRSERERFFHLAALFQGGYTAVMRGDTGTARQAVARIRSRADSLRAAGGPAAQATRLADRLDGVLAARAGDRERAVALFEKGAAAEDSTPPVGPPYLPPSSELLGAVLLDAGRPREARAAYERDLRLRPNRVEALVGLARASSAAGDSAAAAEYRRRLDRIRQRVRVSYSAP
jgi:tetratricopeptide (TPR) repeat protein